MDAYTLTLKATLKGKVHGALDIVEAALRRGLYGWEIAGSPKGPKDTII